MKRDDYFRVTFDHFRGEGHSLGQLGQKCKLAWPKNQIILTKFKLSSFFKLSVEVSVQYLLFISRLPKRS